MSGIGSALTGATQLAQYVIGMNSSTNSNTNGSGTSSSDVNTSVSDDTSSDTKTNTASASTTHSETDTSNVVQNSTDPGVISMLRNLASTAFSNSTDPSKTTGLLSGIIQQAGDAMTSIFGAQRNSGLYN